MNENEKDDQLHAETEPSLDMNIQDNGVETVEEQQEPVSEVLQEVKKFGYKTKEEWIAEGRDPAKFKSPEDFKKFGETYDLVQSLKSELREIRNENKELLEYQKRQAEVAVKQARAELEKQMQLARQAGDVNQIEHLAEQKVRMEEMQRQEAAARVMQTQAQVNMQFVERNKHWYNESRPELQAEAQERATRIFRDNPSISYEAAAMQVESEMKWAHPEINVQPSHQPSAHISANKSNINKSAAELGAPNSETRELKSLTPDQRAEYLSVKKILESNPKIKYTVQDYLKAEEKSKRGLR